MDPIPAKQIRYLNAVTERINRTFHRYGTALVRRGVPPAWFRYRCVPREAVGDHVERLRDRQGGPRRTVLHPRTTASNPLPRNVQDRSDLPDDRGWWGFSFRDVPERENGATAIVKLRDCRLAWYRDPAMYDDFFPGILTRDGRGLDLREIRFRRGHGSALRHARSVEERDRATWIVERVYHNHSHWLTAHLPKILLLRERDELDDVLLPRERTRTMDGSLGMLGLDPDGFDTFDHERPLAVNELTLLETDRFRPELVRLVQEAFTDPDAPAPHRRVYVSRAGATRRRLLNEDEIWRLLEKEGFERVLMEELTFEDQVRLMGETEILAGPHGAGLTNMIFCRPGTHVVEIADLGFPNPNFYALASALGHPYWLVEADAVGDAHPLERDLRVEAGRVEDVLRDMPA